MVERRIEMSRTIRIIAGIGALILIGLLLIITMAFTGNPISKMLATRTANKYIEEKYSDLELQREETYYNFKDESYGVRYVNRRSKDIHFSIGTDYLGRLKYDGYERDVLSKWNTRIRLEDEYNNYVEKIIRDNLDYDYNMIFASTFVDGEKDDMLSDLEIDMIFDLKDIPYPQDLSIYIYENDRTWDRLAEVILQVDEVIGKEDLDILTYTIMLEEPRGEESKEIEEREMFGVYGFPKEFLEMENLPRVLKEFND